jgi:hypothetical protein
VAIGKEAQQAEVIAQLSATAPAGETFIACVHGTTGPSPWMNASPIIRLSRKHYFVTLTNTSVVVSSANRVTKTPGEIVVAFPRTQFPVTRYHRGMAWSKFYVQLPHASKPTRINVHWPWRAELDQLAAAFPAQAGGVPVTGEASGTEAAAS